MEAEWRRRFRTPQRSLPRWARDAPARALYSSNESGKRELYTWQVGQATGSRVTDRPEGTREGFLSADGEWVWWLDDDRGSEFGPWVRRQFTEAGRMEQLPIAPAYSAGAALGTSRAVVGTSRPEGSAIYLLGVGEPVALYQHPELAEVVGLNRDEGLVLLEHSEHGDARRPALAVFDLQGRRIRELWDGPGRALFGGDWSPRPGDDRLIFHHERTGRLQPALWAPAAGTQTELDLDLPGDVEASWFADGRRLLLVHEYRARSQLLAFDLESAQLRPVTDTGGTYAAARVRPDGEIWCAWSSAAEPPRLLRLPAGAPFLASPEEPPGGVPVQEVWAGSVHALFAEPPGARPHPGIFLVHGGPEAHSADDYSPALQAWVDHGFAVVQPNYRGSTGYGREWRDANVGRPGLTEVEDLLAVRDRLVAIRILDPHRIVLSGRSWGGYLTLLGLGTQPHAWSLGIADVPVADYPLAFADEMEPLQASDRALFGGTPDEVPELYREASPLTYAEALAAPVLITAGAHDPRCPIRQVETYVARLRAQGKPHEYYRFEGGHASQLVDEKIAQEAMKIEFAARHLGTPPPRA